MGIRFCTHPLISEVQLFLAEHISEPISVQRMAGEFYLSPLYLSNLFKKQTGETLIVSLNRTRIRYAKYLLLTTDAPLQEIFTLAKNAIVVKEVPANTTVIGMAAHKVQELSRKEAQKFCAYGIDASHPDPMEERFEKLCRELENVKKELAELKKEKKDDAQ